MRAFCAARTSGIRSIAQAVCIALALAAGTPVAGAQSGATPAIELRGGAQPVTLTPERLSALPQVTRSITFKTSKGVATASYSGPLLWEVVQSAKLLDGLEHNAELAKTLLVTATDGYQVAFSIGELSPEFGNAMALLALETDGKPLARGFQIVVDGDSRGARAIHDVVSIELR